MPKVVVNDLCDYIICWLSRTENRTGLWSRDVNSREINFPGGKQISRDSIGTRTSIYKHVAFVLASFEVGGHIFASCCSLQSPVVGPPSGTPRRPPCVDAMRLPRSPPPVYQAPVLTAAFWSDMHYERERSVIELDSSLSVVSVSGTYALGEYRACQILLLTITCNKNIVLEHHAFVHFITHKNLNNQN